MLKTTLGDQVKEAMKSGDRLRVSTLRLLSNALHNEEIAKQRELTEDEEIQIVKRQLKQREESVEVYEKAGRAETAENENEEAEILRKLLPAQMENTQIEQIVAQVITEMGEVGVGDFGKVMQAVMAKVGNAAGGKTVSEIVKNKLSVNHA